MSFSEIISQIAFMLSLVSRHGHPAEVASLGLLHEIGQIVIQLLKDQNPRLAALIEVLDQAQLGSLLLKEWNLPELMRAVAETALLPTPCPCFVRGEDRVNRILEFAEAYAVEGAIYHNLRLCTLFQFETPAVRDALREVGVPMLDLQTDYTAEDTEQLRTRVQAFLEMLGG